MEEYQEDLKSSQSGMAPTELYALTCSPTDEWKAPGSGDIDHKTRGARVRARAAIESIRRGGLADGRIRRGGSLVTFFGFKQCDMDKRTAAESREVGTSSQKPSRQLVSGDLSRFCCLFPNSVRAELISGMAC